MSIFAWPDRRVVELGFEGIAKKPLGPLPPERSRLGERQESKYWRRDAEREAMALTAAWAVHDHADELHHSWDLTAGVAAYVRGRRRLTVRYSRVRR